jgi:hypothetical protein
MTLTFYELKEKERANGTLGLYAVHTRDGRSFSVAQSPDRTFFAALYLRRQKQVAEFDNFIVAPDALALGSNPASGHCTSGRCRPIEFGPEKRAPASRRSRELAFGLIKEAGA